MTDDGYIDTESVKWTLVYRYDGADEGVYDVSDYGDGSDISDAEREHIEWLLDWWFHNDGVPNDLREMVLVPHVEVVA